MNSPTKVMIVDDHAIVRTGLAQIIGLDEEFQIIGEAADGVEAVTKAIELAPDIILMDIFMPRASGIEAMVSIREKMPEIKVMFLTISENDDNVFTALRYGAQGYLLKNSSIENVMDAIRKIATGEAVLSSNLASRLIAEFRKSQPAEANLTEREREVLQMVGEGLANSEIAKKLFIEETTVRTHLQRLIYKLHLKNRAEAIVFAQRNNVNGCRDNHNKGKTENGIKLRAF